MKNKRTNPYKEANEAFLADIRRAVDTMESWLRSSNYDALIIVDKETGVNYLYVHRGYGGGLTPLLDADGKPIITQDGYKK